MNDRGRSRLYAAEQQVGAVLDAGGTVDFFGSTLSVPKQRAFRSLTEVESYLAEVRRTDWGFAGTPPPALGRTRSHRYAYWRPPNLIRIPTHQDWAMRENVILHEYAHHTTFHTTGATGHGPRFRNIYLDLVSAAIGPEAALLLRAALDGQGLGLGIGPDASGR